MKSSSFPFSRRSFLVGFFFLLVSGYSSLGLAVEKTKHHESRAVASSILKSLRERTSNPPLHLATDLYDPSTGLHSEGVWHNCMVGIASLRLSQIDAAQKIANSLWKYSWDGTSFRRRAHSGLWDHSSSSGSLEALEQANYYSESGEHRCVQHGMALVFWSLLIRHGGGKDKECYKEQQQIIAKSFFDEFWGGGDRTALWTTVSKTQGGGTTTRPSASMGQTRGDDTIQESLYYRAVDQAVAVLACLLVLRTLEDDKEEYDRIQHIIRLTCQGLIADGIFGYCSRNENETRSYIGLDRNRNFWHDGWVMLALACAARQEVWYWPSLKPQFGDKQLQCLFDRLTDRYGHLEDTDEYAQCDTVWHWARSMKPDEGSGNVRYCGDNALLYAIMQNLDTTPVEGVDFCETDFWNFIEELRSRDKDGLASVADVYKQVRLHPNTELACLLLWDFDKF